MFSKTFIFCAILIVALIAPATIAGRPMRATCEQRLLDRVTTLCPNGCPNNSPSPDFSYRKMCSKRPTDAFLRENCCPSPKI